MRLNSKDQGDLVAAYQEQLRVEKELKNADLPDEERKRLRKEYNVALAEIVRITMQNR